MKAFRVGFMSAALAAVGFAATAPSHAQTQSNVTSPCDRACLTRVYPTQVPAGAATAKMKFEVTPV